MLSLTPPLAYANDVERNREQPNTEKHGDATKTITKSNENDLTSNPPNERGIVERKIAVDKAQVSNDDGDNDSQGPQLHPSGWKYPLYPPGYQPAHWRPPPPGPNYYCSLPWSQMPPPHFLGYPPPHHPAFSPHGYPAYPAPHPLGPPAPEINPFTGKYVYGGPPPPAMHSMPQKRMRLGIKHPHDMTQRKIRKNALSRMRAATLRDTIQSLKAKNDEHKSEEEAKLFETFEERRERKNKRSKQRAAEKKIQIEAILSKKEDERTPEEIAALRAAMIAKKRKNEGDRLRRYRLKEMGLRNKPPGIEIHGHPRRPLLGEEITMLVMPPPHGSGLSKLTMSPLNPHVALPGGNSLNQEYPTPYAMTQDFSIYSDSDGQDIENDSLNKRQELMETEDKM